MLTSFKSRPAIAVLLLAIAAVTGVFALRQIGGAAPPREVAEADREAGAPPATKAAATDPASEPARTEIAATPRETAPQATTPSAAQRPQTGNDAAETARPASTPDSNKLFHDSRYDELATGAPAKPALPRAMPEVGTTVPVLRPAPQRAPFEDARSVGITEPGARTTALREPSETVAARTARAASPAFTDDRGPLLANPGQQRLPMPERATGQRTTEQTGIARIGPASAAIEGARSPAGAQPFSDDRILVPPPQRAPAIAERREIVQRGQQGLAVVRRESEFPAFIDTRSPIGDTPPSPTPSRVAAAAPPADEPPRARPEPPVAPTKPCEPAQISSEPLDGGRMLMRIASPCRAGQTVRFGYGSATLVRNLDPAGRMEHTLDLFVGTASPIEIVFDDGYSRELPARANDLDRLEKVALIWRAPVDLDLHVFEYGATPGQHGHVWAQAPSSAMLAREQTAANKRGRGFLSLAESGIGAGDKIEVYTFFRHPEQSAGAVAIAVDYATRGDMPSGAACGTGAQAEVRFETVVASRGRVSREAGLLSAIACGTQLPSETRFGIVHQIRVNR